MAKKTKDQYDKEILELAIQTRNWARRMGCFIDPDEEDEKRHGYFTIDEWQTEFSRPQYIWRDVKKKLIAIGEPITNNSFAGHYWGKPGDQAKNTFFLISRSLTMLETAAFQILAMQSTKEWAECQKVLGDKLFDSRHQFKLDEISDLLNGANVKLPVTAERALLPTGDD